MQLARVDDAPPPKGWYLELAGADLPAIGFATQGVNEPHYHRELREVYLVARGSSTVVLDGTIVELEEGDVLVVEPGEVHTFIASSEDYFHFVLHCPRVLGDKVPVARGAEPPQS